MEPIHTQCALVAFPLNELMLEYIEHGNNFSRSAQGDCAGGLGAGLRLLGKWGLRVKPMGCGPQEDLPHVVQLNATQPQLWGN
jgi:hypothetical protein